MPDLLRARRNPPPSASPAVWSEHRLALPLTPVSPIRLCPLPSPLYTVLMGYKESPVPEARARFSPMVRGLFDVFFAAHAACLRGRALRWTWSWPSPRRRARPGRRLARCAGARRCRARPGSVRDWRDDLLVRGPGRLGPHASPARRVRRPAARRSALQGRHLLVLDDTYVSGARAQSAAAALRLAGAASVQIVAAGRVLRPDRVPGPRRLPPPTGHERRRDVARRRRLRLSALRSDPCAERVGARRSAPPTASRARWPRASSRPRREGRVRRGWTEEAEEPRGADVFAGTDGGRSGGAEHGQCSGCRRLPRVEPTVRPSVRRTRLSLSAVPLPARLLCVQPGCAATAMVASPSAARRRLSSWVNSRLASFEVP